jgi:hypothetical protein
MRWAGGGRWRRSQRKDALRLQRLPVDDLFPLLDLHQPARRLVRRHAEERQPVRLPVHGVDRGEYLDKLAGCLLAVGEEDWVHQNFVRARLAAVDAFHDEERALQPGRVLLQPMHRRHRHAGSVRRLHHAELDIALRLEEGSVGVAADDETARDVVAVLAPAGVERPGLAGGTAGDALQAGDGERLRSGQP